MTFKLGLTGSIGMGKTTTAQMFADEGCAVWDADASVHKGYSVGGAAVAPIGDLFPDVIRAGAVDRTALRDLIARDPSTLRQIEAIVHPLVRDDRAQFAYRTTAQIAVFDIPLLFETGAEAEMHAVACVTVSSDIQQKRVLERGKMTLSEFQAFRHKQMPNVEKCARSDFVIKTDTLEQTHCQVQRIVGQIKERTKDA